MPLEGPQGPFFLHCLYPEFQNHSPKQLTELFHPCDKKFPINIFLALLGLVFEYQL